ncbi:MAG: PAS domain S-box protein [Desulfobacteraceae bacterium]|jgi:PAS domain S-box-containing protein
MPESPLIAFCNALLDPVVVVDTAGGILAANPALCDLLGYRAGEVRGWDIGHLTPPHRRREQAQQLRQSLRGVKIVAASSELQTRDGLLIPVLQTLSPFRPRDGADPVVLWTFTQSRAPDPSIERLNLILESQAHAQDGHLERRDTALPAEVTERRGVAKALRLSRGQLRLLSQKTLELLENDRQVIAKELHDSIGASLAAIKFSLEGWLEVYGDRLPSPEIPFERIIAHIGQTIKETKRISANLRPSTLDDLGLLATAQWFCRDLSGLYQGIRITPRFEVVEEQIPEALKIVFYRVMQEALSNAAKHSGAEEVQVTLGLRDGGLEMTISDDGSGFDLERVMGAGDTLSGFGINSMRQRVEICNGSFEIRSRPGQGTRIRVRLPMEAGEGGDCG